MGSERTILTVEEIAAPVPRAIAMGRVKVMSVLHDVPIMVKNRT